MLVDFYKILEQSKFEGEQTVLDLNHFKYIFKIALNSDHPVYTGHFPGNPVVPGVCQIQIIKELLESTIGHKTLLVKSDNIKYLSMINPVATPELIINLETKSQLEGHWNVSATISSFETVFIKFKGQFRIE